MCYDIDCPLNPQPVLNAAILTKLLTHCQDLVDGQFLSADEIHRQTGLPIVSCAEMVESFHVLRSLDIDREMRRIFWSDGRPDVKTE